MFERTRVVTFLLCGSIVMLFVAGPAAADDVWVVRGFAEVPRCAFPSAEVVVIWRADALFYNTADHESLLHLEAVSNGGNHVDDHFSFVIPPGQVRGLAGTATTLPVPFCG